MKKLNKNIAKMVSRLLCIVITAISITSCELDNLDGPDAGLFGEIRDAETGELVPQDIINGSLIEIWEYGWETVTPQRLQIKNDGTYKDSRLFSNTYDAIPINTNFHNNATISVDTVQVIVSGQTELNFTVTPYVRIVDLEITQSGTRAVANFRLEQPVDSVLMTASDTVMTAIIVEEVSVLAHYDPNVGMEMVLADESVSIDGVIQAGVNDVYRIVFDISRKAALDEGGKIFFRVGATTDAPAARANYGATVELEFIL